MLPGPFPDDRGSERRSLTVKPMLLAAMILLIRVACFSFPASVWKVKMMSDVTKRPDGNRFVGLIGAGLCYACFPPGVLLINFIAHFRGFQFG